MINSHEAGGLSHDQARKILADCRNIFVDRLTVALADSGLDAKESLEAFRRGLGEFMDQALSAADGATSFDQLKSLTSSRIKLIEDDDLEVSIELANIAKRLTDVSEEELRKLAPRLASLLGKDEVAAEQNPLGIEAVLAGLQELCLATSGGLVARREVIALAEHRLLRELPLFYAELVERLVRERVPAKTLRVRKEGDGAGRPMLRGESTPAAMNGAIDADRLSALHRAVLVRQGRAAPASGGAGAGAGLDPQTMASMLESALKLLSERQQQQGETSDLFAPASTSGSAAPENTLREIKAGSLGALLGGADAATLDVVTLLFDAMFDDPRLPVAIKAVIGRLQIPVLKAALIDREFLADESHPVRRLLDGIARAAVGVRSDARDDHPVCRMLRDCVATVQNEFERDLSVFEQALAGLESDIARRDYSAAEAAEEYAELASLEEKRELAGQAAARGLRALLRSDVPPPVTDFLRKYWTGRVAEAIARDGEGSAQPRRLIALAADLSWSMRPKRSSEERQKLLARLPSLLREINQELDQMAVPKGERDAFLDTCFAAHAAVLKFAPGANPAEQEVAAEQQVTAATPGVPAGPVGTHMMLQYDGDTELLALRLNSTPAEYEPGLVAQLRIGDWIEFELPDGVRECGRLCWIGSGMTSLLFANPDWSRGIAVAAMALDDQLQRNVASVVSQRSLVGEAVSKSLAAMNAAAA